MPGFQVTSSYPGALQKLNFIDIVLLVVILNVGKYAPQFKMGFTVMSVLSVGEFTMIFVIKWLVDRVRKRDVAAETADSGGQTGDDAQAITLKK